MMRFSPDFRLCAPKEGPYCACCQRPIKNIATAKAVTVNWETWELVEGHIDMDWKPHQLEKTYFGATCWKKIKKEILKCQKNS